MKGPAPWFSWRPAGSRNTGRRWRAWILAAELREPSARWFAAAFQISLALLEGRFADAETLIESALRAGASAEPWDAIIFSQVQRFTLHLEDGRIAEIEPAIRRSVEEFPTRPLFRCLLARLLTELGDEDQARFVFEQLATGRFAVIPVNNDLLLSLGHLAEVAWFLRDADRGAVLHGLLLPYRGLVVDTRESSTGAVDRYLGLAALTAGDLETAERHLQDAFHLNAQIGAQPWAARTQADLAVLLLARDQLGDRERAAGLLQAALGTARQLGMTVFAERAGKDLARVGGDSHPGQAQPRPAMTADGITSWSVCRREGEYWSIAFAGQAFRLKDVKGLHYLAHLLRNPDREFHVLDLAPARQQATAGSPRVSLAREEDLHQARLSDTGPVLDEQAKAAYRARLRELEEELAEAMSWADTVRAAKRARKCSSWSASWPRPWGWAAGTAKPDPRPNWPGSTSPGPSRPPWHASARTAPPSPATSTPPSTPARSAPTRPTRGPRSPGIPDRRSQLPVHHR